MSDNIKKGIYEMGWKFEIFITYYNNENKGEDIFGIFGYTNPNKMLKMNHDYLIDALDIVLSKDYTTPTVDNDFIKITYFDYETYSYRTVFLPIDSEYAEKLIELQQEMESK